MHVKRLAKQRAAWRTCASRLVTKQADAELGVRQGGAMRARGACVGRELEYGGSRPWRHCEVAPSRLPPLCPGTSGTYLRLGREKKASLRSDTACFVYGSRPASPPIGSRLCAHPLMLCKSRPLLGGRCSPLRPCPSPQLAWGTGRPTERLSFVLDVMSASAGPATWVSQIYSAGGAGSRPIRTGNSRFVKSRTTGR